VADAAACLMLDSSGHRQALVYSWHRAAVAGQLLTAVRHRAAAGSGDCCGL
jgi:hypothetical protein